MAGLLVGASIVAVFLYPLRPSIEFTGGTLIEIGYPKGMPDRGALEAKLTALEETLDLGHVSLRPFGTDAYLLRVRELTVSERDAVMQAVSIDGTVFPELRRQNTVGPTIGTELQNKALVAIVVVLLMTVVYIAVAFRQVSKPVSSWKYGLIAIIALVHDIIIPAGVFALVGHVVGAVEVDVLFVTALLTILGYSVNDTIVIFDRVRENLRTNEEQGVEEPFEVIVGTSLEQTFVRSFNTSLTVTIVVVAILLLGGSATRYFALALTAGVVAGTYSSLFLAAPLLVVANNRVLRLTPRAEVASEGKKKRK